MLKSEEIVKRIEKLQLLMLQTPPAYTCEWEVIAVEKIKKLFEMGLLSGGKHMKFLNSLYKDYKYRKDFDGVIGEDALDYRKMDLLFSEDKQDELMYRLRYKYLTDSEIKLLDNTKLKIKELKEKLKDLSIEFDYDTDIMRIRISKKPGDLVMVENPFDDNHSFPAVITEARVETAKQHRKSSTVMETIASRCMIEWHKQDDPSVTGSSTITEYDINTNGTLSAESVSN